jgi:hypothetical protein
LALTRPSRAQRQAIEMERRLREGKADE